MSVLIENLESIGRTLKLKANGILWRTKKNKKTMLYIPKEEILKVKLI